MVGEGSVRLEVTGHRFDRQPRQHRRQHRARHPVRGVDHDAQRVDRLDVHEREHSLDEGRIDIFQTHLSQGLSLGRGRKGQGPVAHLQEPRLAADGQRAAPDDLHARVLLRIVRRGDLDPTVEAELAHGEVEHLGPDHPEVQNVRAAVRGTRDHGRGHRRRVHAHVAADRDALRLELLHVGAADRVRALLVELLAVDPADVVRLENSGIEHRADATGSLRSTVPAAYT